MEEEIFDRKILKCRWAQVTSCLVCESKGIISNMEKTDDGSKFICETCGSEILVLKIE